MRLVAIAGVVSLALFLLFIGADQAGAETYATTCPDPSTFTAEPAIATAVSCAVLAERIEADVTANEQLHQDNLDAAAAASSGASATGTVALAESDRARLDLSWVGLWFALGTSTGVWFFRPLGREMRRWGGETG
jgi:hypothetical protein